ncbi:MAG: long-chain acyl-[acyl-carrier-protein] reductase [Cyanobacteria bacterium MAG APA_bin_95]|nr:long-chain acyl-[acyl-carrier-protein] reductase [Cyanobacteria bacterium MAG APA_bin_95]
MFGLIGHSTSFPVARKRAEELGYMEHAKGDLDTWCSTPPQLLETFTMTSRTGKEITGGYIDSCFLPEMLPTRFKTAARKVQNAMAYAQKNGFSITALGGFTSIIFENFDLARFQKVRSTMLEWQRFTTGNTHTAWIICRQVEENAPRLGIVLEKAVVAVVGATGDIGSAVCRWLKQRTGVEKLLLVARHQGRLEELQQELAGGNVVPLEEALPEADVVVWVASLPRNVEVDTDTLRRPCLMVDGGYPKNLDTRIQCPDLHVLKGGIVEFWRDIGWRMMQIAEMERPNRQMFACFAEAMLLEFEGWHTNFSWGRNNISLAAMEKIGQASVRHGFRALGLSDLVTVPVLSVS